MSIDRKQSILEAAAKSFTLFGYKATTMDQVAKLANVGKGTIYNFFKNKEELFNEIIESLIIETRTIAEDSISKEEPFHKNLHRALYRILEYRKKHQLTIKLFQEQREIGTVVVQEAMNRLEQEILSFLRTYVQKAINKGEIKQCDPEFTAFLLLRLYVSLISDWEKNHEPFSNEEVSHIFQLYLMEGLSTR